MMRSKCGYFRMATLSKPGMVSPMSLNAGFSSDSPSAVVSGRMCSSLSSIERPFWSLTGMIDFENRPSFHAFAALRWESAA